MNKVLKRIILFVVIIGMGCIFIGSGFLSAQERIKPTFAVVQPTPPVQISPADGTQFTNFPRQFTMRWQAKPGLQGVTYEVEVDCLNCHQLGKWDSEFNLSKVYTGLTTTWVQHVFPGDNQGRWRVRAKIGRILTQWSPWWHFSFKTSPTPATKPNICIDGTLKIGNRVTPWGSNYTITLTPQDAFLVSGGKPAFDIYYTVKNCKGPALITKFKNQITFNGNIVSMQDNLSLGAMGSTLPIHTQAYLTPQNGIFKLTLDAGNQVDEEWENDNDVWINIVFSGF